MDAVKLFKKEEGGKESKPSTRDTSTIREIKTEKESVAKMPICWLCFHCTAAAG